MAKVIDITEKLSFAGNPSLKIKGVELEVNGDAETMLKIMAEASDGVADAQKTMRMISLLLPEESRDKLAALKLPFSDYGIVLEEAVALVTGGNEPGEAATRTTT
ncbi:MAG: hypothetical protein LIO78_08285 [Clostridiales bacterium]|nr:hypothetical protein [Clostridiales bacterium]MCC8100040.1 hypothetical protein [Clostridiales bacterium]